MHPIIGSLYDSGELNPERHDSCIDVMSTGLPRYFPNRFQMVEGIISALSVL